MNPPRSPYVGLSPYTSFKERYFFGRDNERKIVAFNLRGSKLTLLYGPAGVGKTSILNAGVFTDLNRLAFENLRISKRPEMVTVIFSNWRDDPVPNLIKEISLSAGAFSKDDTFVADDSSIVNCIEAWTEHLNSDLLIILDQFEEFILYNTGARFDSLATELSQTVNNSRLRANFLISIREDALSKLDAFDGLIPGLFDNYLRIEHLGTNAAQEAIRRPIDVVNDESNADPPYTLGPGLVDEVLRQIALGETPPHFDHEQSGTEKGEMPPAQINDPPIEAALLQMVMKRLWDEERKLDSRVLRLETLVSLGNAPGIVKSHLDREMRELFPRQKEVVAEIFYHLVTPSGWKMAHTAKDLARYINEKEENLEPLLEQLAKARILRIAPSSWQSSGVRRFEILHELFAPSALEWWSRIKLDSGLKKEKRESRSVLEKEKRNSRSVLEKEKRESQRVLRLKLGVTGLFAAVAIVSTVLAAYPYKQAQKAQAARENELFRRLVRLMDQKLPFTHAVLRGHTGSVSKAIFSPDQKLVATISEDETARLWDADSGEEKMRISLPLTSPSDLVFNSKMIVVIASARNLVLWDVTNNTTAKLLGHQTRVTKLALSPGDQFLASGDESGTILLWDLAQNKLVRVLNAHRKSVNDLAWRLQNPPLLASASDDFTAKIWDPSANDANVTVRHQAPVNSVAFSSNGQELLTASDDFTARVSHVSDGALIRTLQPHVSNVYSAKMSSTRIVTTSGDEVRLWQVNASKLAAPVLEGFDGEVRGADFSSDGKKVVTWGEDRATRVFDPAEGKTLYELRGHIRSVNSASFSLDGRLAVTASSDFTARVWDVASNELEVEDPVVSVEGCHPIRVFGRITVKGASGRVDYRIILNGQTRLERTLNFDEPGTKLVGAVFEETRGSVHLQITFPRNTRSKGVLIGPKCAEAPATPSPTPPTNPSPGSPTPTSTPQPSGIESAAWRQIKTERRSKDPH